MSAAIATAPVTGVKRDRVNSLLIVNGIFVAFFCLLPNAVIIDWMWVALFIEGLLAFLTIVSATGNRLLHWFSPSIMAIVYLSLSYWSGAMALSVGIGTGSVTAAGRSIWQSIETSATNVAITLLSSLFLLLIVAVNSISRRNKVIAQINAKNGSVRAASSNSSTNLAIFSAITLIAFSLIPLDLSIAGGGGDFSYCLRFASCVALFYSISERPFFFRIAVYGAATLVMALQAFMSKREVLFVVIVVLLVEIVRKDIRNRLSLKQLGIGAVIAVLCVTLILWSSIMRGYGQYKPTSAWQGLTYIPTYVSEPFFWDSATNNIESNYLFAHSAFCIQLVDQGVLKKQYGSTLAKVLFLPIPRSIYPDKPRSMIDVYTSIVAPRIRSIGGSLPVSIPAELYANFGFLGLPLIIPFFLILERVFLSALVGLQAGSFTFPVQFCVFLSATCVQMIRGNGIEVFLVYAIIAAPLMMLFSLIGASKSSVP